MKTLTLLLILGVSLAAQSPVHAAKSARSVSFRDAVVRGVAGGQVELTGKGTYDPASGLLQVQGTFRCVSDVTQGPLAGCRAGTRGRWEGANVLPSLSFHRTGAAGEAAELAATDGSTLAMQTEFWPGANLDRSALRAKVVVSTNDLDPAQPGVQNVWIEGVGCGDALVAIR